MPSTLSTEYRALRPHEKFAHSCPTAVQGSIRFVITGKRVRLFVTLYLMYVPCDARPERLSSGILQKNLWHLFPFFKISWPEVLFYNTL